MCTQTRALLAMLAVAAAVMTPTRAMAQQPRSSYLVNVDSVPQGATVRLDSETAAPLGTTPLQRVRLPRGPHTLFFTRDGYIAGQISVNVVRSRDNFTSTLTQAGSIYVSADMDGAQIFLDGNAVGTTPGRINNVPPGQHVVEIRQAGMSPFHDTVTVGAGAVASINASIRPPPPQAPPTGIVRVIVSNPNGPAPADLAVTFDGTPMTGTPPSAENAQPGTHIVQVSANGFRTVRREVTVTAGQTFALALDLDAIVQAPTGGSVRVLTQTQGAQVYLDGEVITNAQGGPATRENVPPGTHSLRVSAPTRETVTREISVTAGQATVVEIPDLAQVPQVGRVAIHSPVINSTVFIDGHNVGPAPYERADMPAGTYNVTVRADGYDDGTQTCTVTVGGGCELNVPLNRSVGHASLHVELAVPRPGAILSIDGTAIGEIGAGRDVPNVTAANHELRVRAPNFQDYVENLTLQPDEAHRTIVALHRAHTGPTGQELASRRSAISTWGASPLSRGDVAADVYISLFDYPIAARFTTGVISYGPLGFDVGAGLSVGASANLNLRGRVGYRLLDGLFAVGAELDVFAGLAFQSGLPLTAGLNGWLVASLHSIAPTADVDASTSDDPNEVANRAGSFALSLRLGFEYFNDGLKGMTHRYGGTTAQPGRDGLPACDMGCGIQQTPSDASFPVVAGTGPNMGSFVNTANGVGNNQLITSGTQSLVRPVVGVTIEIGLSRHTNLYFGLNRVISDSPSAARAYYQWLYGWAGIYDPLTYVFLGLTRKF